MNRHPSQEADRRVERGVVWLQRHYPQWWADIIHSRLDMDDPYKCVLGQLAGDYRRVVPSRMSTQAAVMNGFDGGTCDEFTLTADDLTRAWKREIRRRIETATAEAHIRGVFPLTEP